MSIKVLITDPISEKGINLLNENNIEVLYKPDLNAKEYHSVSGDIDGWIIRSGTKINEDFISQAQNLKVIGRAGVGVDNIDIEFATENGIVVMNVPDGNTISAAEHTMALIAALSRNIQVGHLSQTTYTHSSNQIHTVPISWAYSQVELLFYLLSVEF